MKISNSRIALPSKNEVELAIQTMSKKSWRWLVIFSLVLISGAGLLIYQLNNLWLVEIPSYGGEIIEGMVGAPRFVNPALDVSEVDRDLTTLIYSGLLRLGRAGQLIPDLAADYEISPDYKTYTFTLKENLTWHDGEPLTVEDIIFTIEQIKNPIIKSQRSALWEAVGITKLDDRRISFTLREPYPEFLENTTTGILPKHLWQNIEPETFAFSELNIRPVGSGPYKIKDVKLRRGSSKLPEYYELQAFKNFALGEAKISRVLVRFYPNEEELLNAFRHGEIDGLNGLAPERAAELTKNINATALTAPLPRLFAVFFNQNQSPIFASEEVRRALKLAIDRQSIVNQILKGYGMIATDPLLVGLEDEDEKMTLADRQAKARQLLEKNGWLWNQTTGVREKTNKKKETAALSFSLATSEVPELKAAAEMLKNYWEEIGAKVELKIFEIGDLNQNTIRPRQYEALLFGEVLGRGVDPYSFWHSSERLDPGSNIALYTNLTADKMLDDLRRTNDQKERAAKRRALAEEIMKDTPIIPLYQPKFIYLTSAKIKNNQLPPLNLSNERFSFIHEWYSATEKVWKIFQ